MPPEFKVPIMDPVFVYEQSSMEVACQIIGGPIPTITWLKGNTLVSGRLTFIYLLFSVHF